MSEPNVYEQLAGMTIERDAAQDLLVGVVDHFQQQANKAPSSATRAMWLWAADQARAYFASVHP